MMTIFEIFERERRPARAELLRQRVGSQFSRKINRETFLSIDLTVDS